MKNKTLDIAYIGMCIALITVCSWISLPLTVPITLQTLAVFITAGLLGLKRGTITIFVYILLGALGVPVFAGFKGGIGALTGNTGGYILGFLLSVIVVGLFTHFFGYKTAVLSIGMVLGLIICYAFGTIWFLFLYTKNVGTIGILSVLNMCVVPFIIPDLIKIAVAVILVKRLKSSQRIKI